MVSAPSLPHQQLAYPIYLLPFELLVKVIWFTALGSQAYNNDNVTSPFLRGYYKRLHGLAQVCRLWARAVKDRPGLWRFINAEDTPFERETALKRSRDHPVVVRCHGSAAGELWPSISEHIRRWEIALVSFRSCDPMPLEALAVLENPAPALSTFQLNPSSYGSEQQVTLHLFSDWAPRLRDLSISHVALQDWASPVLRGLHSLSLAKVSHSGPSLHQLLDALESCPELRELELISVLISDTTIRRRATVVLVELTTLLLIGINSPVITRLLQNVDAPNCKTFSLSLVVDDSNVNEVHDVATAWIAPVFKRYLSSGGHLEVYISHLTHVSFELISPEPSSSRLSISIVLALPSPRPRPLIMDWGLNLIAPIATQPHNPLAVTVNFETLHASQLREVLTILRRLPKITTLDLSNYEDDLLVNLLKELSWGSVAVAPGTSSWLCPDLREMSIGGCSEDEVLLGMVVKRTQAAALNEAGAEANGVVRLRKLTVFAHTPPECTVSEQTMKEMQRILGTEGKCVWLTEDGDEVEDLEDEDGSVDLVDMDGDPDDEDVNLLGISPGQAMQLVVDHLH